MKLPNTPSRLLGPAARTQSICWLAISMMWPRPITAENTRRPVGVAQTAKPAIEMAADLHGNENREDREGTGDEAQPDDREPEFNGAIRDGDAHERRDHLDEKAADEQRNQQRVVDVAIAELC